MSFRLMMIILCLFIISSCNSFKGSDSQDITDETSITMQLKDATGNLIPAGATIWIAPDEADQGAEAQRIKPKARIDLNCETPTREFEEAFCVNETGTITFRCRNRRRRRRKKRVFITYKGQSFRLRNMTCAQLAESLKEEVEVPVNTESFVVVANTGTSDLSILD